MRHFSAAFAGAAVLMCGAVLAAQPAVSQNAAVPNATQDTGADQHLASAEPAAPNTPAAASAAADPAAPSYNADGIAAIVNNQVISDYELQQRVALFMATSGIQNPTPEETKNVRAQQLDQLETDKLELQEALKQHVTVPLPDVTKRINQMLDENHITLDQLRTTLDHAGVEMATLQSQITAQIAWQKTVQQAYGDRVDVTPAEVDAEIARYAEGADKPHFLVSEIFVGVESPDQNAKVLKDLQNIQSQLRAGATFSALAHQFSQSPSAAAGGDIGWIADGQLQPKLNAELDKLPPGHVSEPIRTAEGYYILGVRERLEPLGTNVTPVPVEKPSDDGTVPLVRITLPLNPTASQAEADAAIKVATELGAAVTSCTGLQESVSKEVPAAIYNDMGATKLADLDSSIGSAIAEVGPGAVTPPLKSAVGIELFVRCDKRPPPQLQAFTLPTRGQVEEQLFEDQISALARRYMRDLKHEANVEVR